MPARLDFQFDIDRSSRPRDTERTGQPMRLLLMGDFSAEAARSGSPLAQRKPIVVDIDTLDAAMQKLSPQLELLLGSARVSFEPRSLDDFHPDRLLVMLPPLAQGLSRLQRLSSPTGFAQAAAEWDAAQASSPPAPVAPTLPAAQMSGQTSGQTPGQTPATQTAGGDGLLAQLLGGQVRQARTAAPAATAAAGIEALIQGMVAPHVVAAAPARQGAYIAAAQALLAEQLRAVLHAPAFQALEACWRGVQFLVSRLELDERLQLSLFDVSRQELLVDIVASQGRLQQTGLHRSLVDRDPAQPGGAGWAAWISMASFADSDTDIGLLAALGVLARLGGAPLLATSQLESGPAQAPSSAGWMALRGSEVAPWIGLVTPRLLMRLPYGKGCEATEHFAFEEFSGSSGALPFLWGPGALATALLLGQGYTESGGDRDSALAQNRQIDDLPAYTRRLADGEFELQACAETYLSDAAGESLLQAGLMPLASHRQRNTVSLLRWQSVALPAQALAGLQGP